MNGTRRKGTITNFQLFTLVTNSMIATGVFTIARTTSEVAGRGFMLAIPLAGLLVLAQLFGMHLLNRRFPDQSPAEFAPIILGKWLGSAYLLGYFLVALSLSTLVPRNFWIVLNAWIFQDTPQYALLLPLALVCWNISRRGVVVLSRMSEILFVLSIPTLIIMIVPHQTFELEYLLPVLDKGPLDILKGVLPAYFSMTGFDIFLFAHPFTERQKSLRIAGAAILLTSVFYTLVSVMVIGTIGLELTLINTWPLQQYLNHFSFAFLERIDIIILILWSFQVITTAAIPLFIAGTCLRGIWPKLNSRRATDIALSILVAGLVLPIRLPSQMKLVDLYSYASMLYVGFFPFLLWTIALVRKKGGKLDAAKQDAA